MRRALLAVAGRSGLHRRTDGRIAFPYVELRRDRRYLVLVYHRINDERTPYFTGVPVRTFQRQMERLLEHGPVLPLAELVERARSRDLPPGASAVTFDDGYRDNYEQAFPVLRRLGIPATIFLATGAIDTGDPLWHDLVFDAFGRASGTPIRLDGAVLSMDTPRARQASLHAFLHAVWLLTPRERLATIQDVLHQMGENPAALAPDRMVTWEQVRSMSTEGVSFGAHTVTHAILSRMPLAEAREEIERSRRTIEGQLGTPITLFAYPIGRREDYTEDVKNALQELGFACAVTTIFGPNHAGTNPFELRRVGAWDQYPDRASMRLAWYRFAD